MMTVLFSVCSAIVLIGFLWFFLVRPILEDAGVIAPRAETVNTNEQPASIVMSRADDAQAGLTASALQTDTQTDARQTKLPPDVMLDICRDLRRHNYSRDDARALLRKWGQPLDNNIWAQAAQPTPDAEHVTPIAGRRTDAVFDADFPYQAPPAWSVER